MRPLCLLFACACVSSPDSVATDQVVHLSACSQPSDTCVAVADGKGPMTVAVSTPVPAPRATTLDAHLKLSSGTWQSPPDPTQPSLYTASLAASGAASQTFVPPLIPGPVRIDAELLSYVASTFVILDAAPLAGVILSSVPPSLPGAQSATVQIACKVRAQNGGRPSVGTTVKFSVTSVEPPGAYAGLQPAADSEPIDSSDTATTTLLVGASVRSVVVHADAAAPVVGSLSPHPHATGDLTVQVAAP